MNSNISLGRIAGIQVGLNWTWFIVFALVTWSLASAVFPSSSPGLDTAVYWVMGAAAAVLFFGSILLHELGHALQARRDDVEIERITLWLFGGVAQFKSLYDSPGAEFRVAVAGPLVTLVIALVLLPVALFVPLPEAVSTVLLWLGYIQVTLLVFNLLPALPLDGGRILHSALWRRKHDLVEATQTGTAIGIAFGYLMIGAGFVLFFVTAAFTGLWLAFIGWFLMSAARAEAQQIVAHEALSGLHVRDLMAQHPLTVSADMTLGAFVDDVASQSRFTTYPVTDGDGEVVGLLRLEAVAKHPRQHWDERRVRECMVPRERVPVLHPDDEAEEVLQTLAGSEVNRAVVVEGEHDRLVGLLSITDVVRAVQLDGARRRREQQPA